MADTLTPQELADHAWELADKIRFCLFTTWDGQEQRMRPLTATVERDSHRVRFLVSASGGTTLARAGAGPDLTLVEQVQKYPVVTLGFADPKANDYATMTGEARVSADRQQIEELWSPFAKAWWAGADDPDIRVLTFVPEKAEVWIGPNKLVAYGVMLAAAVSSARPDMGEHGATAL